MQDLSWVKEIRVEEIAVLCGGGDGAHFANEALRDGWKLLCIKSEQKWDLAGKKETRVTAAVFGR